MNYICQITLDLTVGTLQKTLDRIGCIVYSHVTGLKAEWLRVGRSGMDWKNGIDL